MYQDLSKISEDKFRQTILQNTQIRINKKAYDKSPILTYSPYNNLPSNLALSDSLSSSSSINQQLNDYLPYIQPYDPSLVNPLPIQNPMCGFLLIACSAFCYSLLNIFVKSLMTSIPWQQIMLCRMCVTWIATCIWIIIKDIEKLRDWREYNFTTIAQIFCGPQYFRSLVCFRAIFLWTSLFCCWWSFEYLPVGLHKHICSHLYTGDAVAITMSFPLCVSIISHCVWRNESILNNTTIHTMNKCGIFCLFIGLFGVLLICQPSFIFNSSDVNEIDRDIGIVIALMSALCFAIQYVLVNYMKDDIHWLQIEHVSSLLSAFLLTPIGILIFWSFDNISIPWNVDNVGVWCEQIALGFLGFICIALLTRGSQLDIPARTSLCLYIQIPFTYLGQILISGKIPNVYIIVGTVLVVVSIAIPWLQKYCQRDERVSSGVVQGKVDVDLYDDCSGNVTVYGSESGESQPLLNCNQSSDGSNNFNIGDDSGFSVDGSGVASVTAGVSGVSVQHSGDDDEF